MSDNLQLELEDTGDFGIDYFTISFRPEESILQILVGSLRSHLEHSGYRLTLYVGKRGAWRFCRVYEKHHQMAAAGVQLPFSQLRFEIEFRSNNDIEIPLNVFENISGYVQQAYPRLYEKLLCAIPEPFKTKTQFKTKAFEVPLYALIQHLKNTYGGVVHAMELNGMSAEQIVASLTKDKLPKRLLFPVPKTR